MCTPISTSKEIYNTGSGVHTVPFNASGPIYKAYITVGYVEFGGVGPLQSSQSVG